MTRASPCGRVIVDSRRHSGSILCRGVGRWRSLVIGLTEPLTEPQDSLTDSNSERPEIEELHADGIVITQVFVSGLLSSRARSISVYRRLLSSNSLLRSSRSEAQPELDGIPALASAALAPLPYDHRSTTRRAHLLTLEPAFQTSKVEDVSAPQLLRPRPLNGIRIVRRIPGPHLLTTDDARVLACKILLRCVWYLVHVVEGAPVSKKGLGPLHNRAGRHEQVPHDMDGKPVEGEEDTEEGQICYHLYGI